ncbi:hypothetical protein BX600DRAFT_390431 [Xylariales sp. PMI_506]|nr:hypothetical protein BX600DRAFT_390431 [Xylariales sp. PMI_506]
MGAIYVSVVTANVVPNNNRHWNQNYKTPYKLIMLEDGFVSPFNITYGYYYTLCTTKPGVSNPILNTTQCKQMAVSLHRCNYLHKYCHNYPDSILYKVAESFCSNEISDIFHSESGGGRRDPFNITQTCELDLDYYTLLMNFPKTYINPPFI